MGGKSRKTGGVSAQLIRKIKGGSCCGKKKVDSNSENNLGLDKNNDNVPTKTTKK